MNTFLLLTAAATLLFFLEFGIEVYTGDRSTTLLEDIAPCGQTALPRVSIVIPARNEERNIREALQSILRQDYPNLEFIVMNDRSTDRTGAILAEMASH